jgi:hypothetical protein
LALRQDALSRKFSRMRTTIEIADELLRRAQKQAADVGVPLGEIIEDALRHYLADKPKGTGYKLQWSTEKGEMMPAVDLDDRGSLLDIMNGNKE